MSSAVTHTGSTKKGPLYGRELPVVDLHAHPTLKTLQFNKKFWDRHNPPGFFFCPFTMRTDLDALIDGGVKTLCCSVYVVERGWLTDVWPLQYLRKILPSLDHVVTEEPDDMTREYLNHLITVVRETNARRGPVVEIARSFEHMKQINAEGRIAIVNTIEGAHSLNGNLDNLDDFHRRGVSAMIVPHMYPNEACYSCANAIPEDTILRKIGCFTQKFLPEKGLTPFGRDLIDKMFDIGMLVDMTHGTPAFRKEVLDMARNHPKKRPVIMSHVGVYHYCPCHMNPTIEDIKQIAETGGAIGVIFMETWLKRPPARLSAEVVLATVEHLVKHGGEDIVAFGSDYDGFTYVPKDFKSPRDYNRLRDLLRKRYTDTQVEKFLSGNAERVLAAGWDAPR